MNTSKKTCFKCLISKPLSEFYKHKMMADGHLNKCKACAKADVSKHREENIEKIREYDRSRSMLAHRVAARAEYAKTDASKASVMKSAKKYAANFREKRLETNRNYYGRNKSACRERTKRYAENNKEKMRIIGVASQSKRRAAAILRTPKWLTSTELAMMKTKHKEAAWMTRRTGVSHHVDHIVPLRGRLVSGLHVPWNLRVIPARENLRKHNKF